MGTSLVLLVEEVGLAAFSGLLGSGGAAISRLALRGAIVKEQ